MTEWVTSEPIELSGDSQKYGTEAKPQTYLQPLLKLPKDSINDFLMILTMSRVNWVRVTVMVKTLKLKVSLNMK